MRWIYIGITVLPFLGFMACGNSETSNSTPVSDSASQSESLPPTSSTTTTTQKQEGVIRGHYSIYSESVGDTSETEQCYTYYSYPVISSNRKLEKLDLTNRWLKLLGDYDGFVSRCTTPRIVDISHKVLYYDEHFISVEYLTKQSINGDQFEEYKAVIIDPNSAKILQPEQLFEGDFKPIFYKYVNEYVEREDVHANLYAYDPKSDKDIEIIYAITPQHFIIYAGGEGEYYGDFKVEIPLSEFTLNDKFQYLKKSEA